MNRLNTPRTTTGRPPKIPVGKPCQRNGHPAPALPKFAPTYETRLKKHTVSVLTGICEKYSRNITQKIDSVKKSFNDDYIYIPDEEGQKVFLDEQRNLLINGDPHIEKRDANRLIENIRLLTEMDSLDNYIKDLDIICDDWYSRHGNENNIPDCKTAEHVLTMIATKFTKLGNSADRAVKIHRAYIKLYDTLMRCYPKESDDTKVRWQMNMYYNMCLTTQCNDEECLKMKNTRAYRSMLPTLTEYKNKELITSNLRSLFISGHRTGDFQELKVKFNEEFTNKFELESSNNSIDVWKYLRDTLPTIREKKNRFNLEKEQREKAKEHLETLAKNAFNECNGKVDTLKSKCSSLSLSNRKERKDHIQTEEALIKDVENIGQIITNKLSVTKYKYDINIFDVYLNVYKTLIRVYPEADEPTIIRWHINMYYNMFLSSEFFNGQKLTKVEVNNIMARLWEYELKGKITKNLFDAFNEVALCLKEGLDISKTTDFRLSKGKLISQVNKFNNPISVEETIK